MMGKPPKSAGNSESEIAYSKKAGSPRKIAFRSAETYKEENQMEESIDIRLRVSRTKEGLKIKLENAPIPRLLPIKDAAKYLGATVWHVRSMVWARQIPHARLGKRIVIDRADLDCYVERIKVGASWSGR
jgi:excisionase family DNA binding protein